MENGRRDGETAEEYIERLEAEKDALEGQLAIQRSSTLKLRISEKGGLSVYGLGRFPVTLYKSQWKRLISEIQSVVVFIKDNDRMLKEKA